MASQAEKKIQTTTYSGEKRRWNFEKYVKVHVDNHAILDGLMVHGYAGMDVRSRVRHFIAGIKDKDLENVKMQILSDRSLRRDFHACVTLYQDFIKQINGVKRDATISAVKTDQKTDGDDADMSVPDRYYTKKEYLQLSPAQKRGLKKKRQARGPKTSSPKRRRQTKDTKGNLSKQSVNMIVAAIKAAQQEENDDAAAGSASDSSSDDQEPPPKKKSNRHNKALKRRK